MNINTNEKKSRMGKYEGFHGTIRMGEAQEAAPRRGLVSKGGGKPLNYPMDSDEAFAKRLKYYEARKQAEQEAAESEAVPA